MRGLYENLSLFKTIDVPINTGQFLSSDKSENHENKYNSGR